MDYFSDEDEENENGEDIGTDDNAAMRDGNAGEKLYVIYSVNVLRRSIHTMKPLSGIAYKNNMYFVLSGPNLKKVRPDDTVGSWTFVGLRYGAFMLDETWCGSGNEVETIIGGSEPVIFLPKLKWGCSGAEPDLDNPGYAVHRYDWKWYNNSNHEFQYVNFPTTQI